MAKSKSPIKNLNAPKKITWAIALFAALIGLILAIAGKFSGTLMYIGFGLVFVSAALMLLSSYVKGL